jgi:DNA-binding NarL/FixJ family response regulator
MAATPSPLAISVMLVDDHPVMRVGLANVLSLNHEQMRDGSRFSSSHTAHERFA